MRARTLTSLILVMAFATACSSNDSTTSPGTTVSFTNSPCSVSGTLQLSVAQATRVDCSNGGTTLTLEGNGASYLIVAQLATDLVPNAFVKYHVASGTALTAARIPVDAGAMALRAGAPLTRAAVRSPETPTPRLREKQMAFDRLLRARARAKLQSGAWSPSKSFSVSRLSRATDASSLSVAAVTPVVGTVRPFRVLADTSGNSFKTVQARLVYADTDVLLYVDTLAAAGGFSASQLQAFGQLFDQTLYPIDTSAYGPPSDIDQNGHVVMLMSPAVNALTSAAQCATQGYVAGFFEEEDLGASPGDPNSNEGEIFYSIVPDPNGTASCAHSTDDVGLDVPPTFLHELQHLISFSQHVVVHGGDPEYGWLDEGLSIVAEELGSLYYEQKCPGTACRTSPSQLFPDSSQGFIGSFLYDSYQYALLPDTASVTLHSDSDDGFSWRGGDWLLVRWLGDQFGTAAYKRLDENALTGVANIANVTGQPFPTLFANFGLALFVDSLPGLPRTTAPTVDRFTIRNVRQLWNRLYTTSAGSDVPLAFPLQLFAISSDTSAAVIDPGTGSYFRLDTPTTAATVTIQFSAPSGASLPASLKPQLAVFRLPPGQ